MILEKPRLRQLGPVAIGIAAFTILSITYHRAETPPWAGKAPASGIANAPLPAPPVAPLEIAATDPAAPFTPFTFVTYNVRNWLSSSTSPEKSPEAKNAVIRVLVDANADVIGISEIGNEIDLAEIAALLNSSGARYPHTYHTGGVDPVRHLGLLSKYPVISTSSPAVRLSGTALSMQRGMLDATVDMNGSHIRFIGLHLKSKRIVRGFDQALLRFDEARHVRKHIDSILAAVPQTRLIVYGDFNDTTRSRSSRAIYGTYRTPGYMSGVRAADSRGETWTHRYSLEDAYSRIDFVTVSPALRKHVSKKGTRVIDDPLWEIASDHRPVVVAFD